MCEYNNRNLLNETSTSVSIYNWNIHRTIQNHQLPRRLHGKSSWRRSLSFSLSWYGKKCDINRPIVFEPRRSLWKLSCATFSAKQSSVAMIQDQEKDGEKLIDHLRRSINRKKKPHRAESTRRHSGCTRDAIKLACDVQDERAQTAQNCLKECRVVKIVLL